MASFAQSFLNDLAFFIFENLNYFVFIVHLSDTLDSRVDLALNSFQIFLAHET